MRNDIVLCPADLAVIARDLLVKNGGFTIDEYGVSAEGDRWAVAIEGKEHRCAQFGVPPLRDFEQYLLKYPISGSGEYFGGCFEFGSGEYLNACPGSKGHGCCVLDHALLFTHKHTAVHEGLRQKQDSIYHLGTGELQQLEGFAITSEPCNHPHRALHGLTGE